ncbi:AbrB/MazE/SpoVT family DNA-binding domain-containing protein [Devosia sp. YIM 151766]|uniref:AbrB/MazE/SpoVT family DNA-binding domain-containing protein n=1 Tax=Devosia sp. YIM 151766 TaxID=3017325 RepID=UPI00255C534C|nr:AbrB/MazE/SpoVT family DNA-binding domain-containing protein [Devosia sp. YIM 151766]WIY52261.1 AbrB/MazE/SpoVT family DNA-binding domain-containing protein [Devosia sp. YIM 151766]
MTAHPGYLTKTRLKKAGGSLIVTVPAAARHSLLLREGQELAVSIEGDRLILQPVAKTPRYRLEDLMGQCELDASHPDETRDWLDAPPVGREIL